MAVSYTDWGADPPARPVPEPPTSAAVAEPRARPSETLKLLCLHGWRSNRRVTSLQLSNLGLHVDPDYGGDGALARLVAPTLIDGPVRSSRAYDTLLGEMFAPPWCSWVDGADGPEHDTPAGLAMLPAGKARPWVQGRVVGAGDPVSATLPPSLSFWTCTA